MSRKILQALTFIIVFNSYSQSFQSVEEINEVCSQLGFAANEDAEIAVDNILEKIGLFKNFVLQECPNINNAVAKNVDIGNGRKERYILYDNEFFNKIEDKAANDWAAISILAHEIGHHLNGHSLNDDGSNHRFELEADEFSGFVLAKMESSLEDAQSAIQTLRYEKATRTHPAKADRLVAIERGWNKGMGIKKPKKKVTKVTEEVVINDDDNKVVEEDEVIVEDNIVIGEVTAEQVLANYIEAIGGIDNIMKIKTMKQYIVGDTKVQGIESSNEMNMTQTYLTPSKYHTKFKMNILDTQTETETLFLGSKIYSRVLTNGKGKWTESETKNDKQNEISYIPEYSQLINSAEKEYLGIKKINGVDYYVINFPNSQTMEINQKDYWSKTVTSQTKFFNINTGLLEIMEQRSVSETKYKKKRMKNYDSTNESTFKYYFADYKPVNGVLFPFKTSTIIDGLSETNTTIEQIEINPEIDKQLFEEK